MKRTLLALLLVATSFAPAAAQTVAQGRPADALNGTAWPVKIVFGNAQVDPRAGFSSAETTLQNAATAAGNGTALDVSSYSTVVIEVVQNAANTIVFEASEPTAGYVAVLATKAGTNTKATSTADVGTTVWRADVVGYQNFRARISNYVAGTTSVYAIARSVPPTHDTVNASMFGYDPNSAAQAQLTVSNPPAFNNMLAVATRYDFSSVQSRLADSAGNYLDSAATAPTGSERGLITRNVPSGTQTVSGTVTATPSGTTTVQWTNPAVASGTLTTTTCPGTGCVLASGLTQASSVTVGITGTFTGVAVVNFDQSEDGTNFAGMVCNQSSTTSLISNFSPTSGSYEIIMCPLFGQISDFRVRMTLAPGTGSVAVRITASSDPAVPPAYVVKQGGGGSGSGTSWFMRITDNNFNGPATVKSASTAAVASDPSLVVALSPNSPIPTGANTIGALTANQSVNVAQVAGTAVDTNSGNKSAGTIRVVLATDQPQLTNKLLVTPDSVALPANQSVNVNQVGGSAVSTAATGVQKVGVTGSAGAALDAANNAAMPANAMAEGLQTATIDASPTAATAGNLRYLLGSTEGVAYVQEGGPKRFSCVVPSSTTATTQCQAAPGAGLRAYVTSAHMSNAAATVQTLDIVFGTGTNCATGIAALTHKWQMGTNATTTSPQSIEANFTTPLVPTAANAICVRPANATAFGATITGFIAP